MSARRLATRNPFSLPSRPMAAAWASDSARFCKASALVRSLSSADTASLFRNVSAGSAPRPSGGPWPRRRVRERALPRRPRRRPAPRRAPRVPAAPARVPGPRPGGPARPARSAAPPVPAGSDRPPVPAAGHRP
jgi:hypothetical protein